MYPAGNLFIPASHGQLEAILKESRTGDVRGVTLVLHPASAGRGHDAQQSSISRGGRFE